MDIKNIKKINLKILLCNIAGIAVLLLFTNVVIAYSKGEFEIPLYDRTESNYVINLPTNPRAETETAEETPTDAPGLNEVINQSHFIEESEEPAASDAAPSGDAPEIEPAHNFGPYTDELKKLGFAVSDGVYKAYDEAAVNAQITAYQNDAARLLAQGEQVPPPPQLYEYMFVQITPEYPLPKTRQSSSSNMSYIAKQAVEAFMDYLIIRSEEYEILCTADGRLMTRDFGAMNLEILKMRDTQNKTVFKSKTEEPQYYFYDPDAGTRGAFNEINFNPLFGDRGIPFMYPSYYGAEGANNRERTRSPLNGKWGYAESDTKKQIVGHIYGAAFNFRENIAIAYQDSPGRGNKLFFLNENGQDLLAGDYFAPDAEEIRISHLGFFYFDNGLTRAYWRSFDRRGFEIETRETILKFNTDINGYAYFSEFYIPEDYNIKAYSNGMILLEKNGYYGFMNYLGEWAVQPIYRYAQPFFEGVAVIGLDNGKRALIDAAGNRLTRFRYDYISNCTGGIVALFEKTEGWTILNKVRRTIEFE